MMDVEVGAYYKHFKGGIYQVLLTATSCDTLEPQVIYKSIPDNKCWVRSLSEFTSLVDRDKYPDVKQLYRFQKEKIG